MIKIQMYSCDVGTVRYNKHPATAVKKGMIIHNYKKGNRAGVPLFMCSWSTGVLFQLRNSAG